MYESMVIYRSFYEAIQGLEPAIKGEIYDAIIGYGLNGIEPDLEGVAKAIFTLVKPQIDANNRRKENGAKAHQGRTKEEPKSDQTATESEPNSNLNRTKTEPNPDEKVTESEPNVNVNVNANVNANVNNNKGAKMRCEDARLDAAVKDFIDHRKKLRKPMTDKAVELFIDRVKKMSSTIDGQIALINTAIERGWQTVYPGEEKPKKRDNKSKLQALEDEALGGD